eukprot:scaffold2103_cov185-Amphora_coffeaeformis.AAC.3
MDQPATIGRALFAASARPRNIWDGSTLSRSYSCTGSRKNCGSRCTQRLAHAALYQHSNSA